MAEMKCPSCHLMSGGKAKSYDITGDVIVSYLPRIVFAKSVYCTVSFSFHTLVFGDVSLSLAYPQCVRVCVCTCACM